jgi:hypothetical protein
MKCSTKKIAAFLIDFKSMMFGLTIFALIRVCLHSPDFEFPSDLFLALMLLAAAILIRLDQRWSNLIAATISGFLPIEFLRAFLMFPYLAEVRMLSFEHFYFFFRDIRIENFVVVMSITLLMLTRSAYAVIRNDQSETATQDRAR